MMDSDDDEIRAIRREFVEGLQDRVIAIREAAFVLEHDPSPEAEARLKTLTHRLRGTAGSFGVGELGELARNIDKALVAPIDWNQVQAAISVLALAAKRVTAV